jgi:cobalamin biosynthetic protein CobC
MSEPSERRFPDHGGDIDFATTRYGTPTDGWLDLSTGVSPHPYPAPAIGAGPLTRLPGGSQLGVVLTAARAAYRVPDAVAVAATPGTEIALRLLPFVSPPGPVAVVSPTYPSHGEAWGNAGRAVTMVGSVEDGPPNAVVVVLANPNNPDGRRTEPVTLTALAARLAARQGLLVVDEAFADVVPELSVIPHGGDLPIVVLRSFGKFFGLPGLRLGFVVGHPSIVARLASLLGDWPVSSTALAIGSAALGDTAWQTAAQSRLATDAARLRGLLERHGLTVLGGTGLFVLAETADALTLHERLARAGIWTRAFADHPTWLRFGLPAGGEGFDRLDRALLQGTHPRPTG